MGVHVPSVIVPPPPPPVYVAAPVYANPYPNYPNTTPTTSTVFPGVIYKNPFM